MFNVYPIAWITKSKYVMDFIRHSTTTQMSDDKGLEFMVADYAAGEHDRVPSFFVKIISEFLEDATHKRRMTVYSIDLHALRLDSLLGKLEESGILDRTRVVEAKLESMDTNACFRPDMMDFLNQNPSEMTWLDSHVFNEKRIPPESFDIGVLNNDVVGYLHEYYKEYSQATLALEQVFKTLKSGGLLIVTMPCSLYLVDNVGVLENVNFKLVEGMDIDMLDGRVSRIDKNAAPKSLSRLNHYSFLVFSKP